jgi:hypothetical protein
MEHQDVESEALSFQFDEQANGMGLFDLHSLVDTL